MTIVVEAPSADPSVTSYTTLQTDIADWLARSDLSADVLGKIVRLAESKISRSLRTRAQETAYFRQLDADAKAPVPVDFLEFKEFFLQAATVLVEDVLPDLSNAISFNIERAASPAAFRSFSASSADGAVVTRVNGYFYLSGKPVGTYAIGGTYYAKFPALTDANPTNWLTENSPDLLLAACVSEGAAYIKAWDQVKYWTDRFDGILDELQQSSEREDFSGSRPRMRTRTCA